MGISAYNSSARDLCNFRNVEDSVKCHLDTIESRCGNEAAEFMAKYMKKVYARYMDFYDCDIGKFEVTTELHLWDPAHRSAPTTSDGERGLQGDASRTGRPFERGRHFNLFVRVIYLK